MARPIVAHSFAVPIILFFALWVACYLPLGAVLRVGRGAVTRVATRIRRLRPVKWLAHRESFHGLRPYFPAILVVLAGGVLAAAGAHLFVEIAQTVRDASSTLSQVDQSVQAWFLQHRQPGVILLLRIFTFIGSGTALGTLVGILSVILILRRETVPALYLLITTAGGYALNMGLKMMFARSRPDLASAVVGASSYAFPSGHAMVSFIVFVALSFLALRRPWPWIVNSVLLALAGTLVIMIGLSRVYLGVHWVSDIMGGWIAGIIWVLATSIAFHLLLGSRTSRPSRAHRAA